MWPGLKMSVVEMPDDGQQLNTSLFSNSRPYCYLDREECCKEWGRLHHGLKFGANISIQSIGIVVVVGR